VRELRNFIYRLALLAREDVIDASALEPMLATAVRVEDAGVAPSDLAGAVEHWLAQESPPAGHIYDAALAAFETPLFIQILGLTGGNQLRAAQMLGINRNTLRKRLGELAIDPDKFLRRP